MKQALYQDKNLVVELLTKAFNSNPSVNYIIKQDKNILKRIKALMAYSFEVCYLFGQVFLSDDEQACALILFPD